MYTYIPNGTLHTATLRNLSRGCACGCITHRPQHGHYVYLLLVWPLLEPYRQNIMLDSILEPGTGGSRVSRPTDTRLCKLSDLFSMFCVCYFKIAYVAILYAPVACHTVSTVNMLVTNAQ